MHYFINHDSHGGYLFLLLSLFLILIPGCSKPPENMINIPSGEFIMGSDDVDKEAQSLQVGGNRPWFANERPLRKVYLKRYYIDTYEVTIGQYMEFLLAAKRPFPEHWSSTRDLDAYIKYPVVYVSWYDARDYCQWKGKRLPTEEEWEKAARGTDGRRFPWGNEFDSKTTYCNCLSINTGSLPVGSMEADKSPYGVYDMAGNVSEWTADWYKQYPGNDFNDAYYGEKYKVVRGGAWGQGHYSLRYYLRTSCRDSIQLPVIEANDLGFRCVKDK